MKVALDWRATLRRCRGVVWQCRSIALQAILAMAIVLGAQAQEAVMEEVRVEGSFTSGLDLPNDRAVDLLTRRLLERDSLKHNLELQLANRSPLTALLSLTSAIPIPLGSSENRVDTFVLQNYVRGDLNPSRENPLFDSKPGKSHH